jgi:HAD superfamily hydrolase (TIGR01549 family)
MVNSLMARSAIAFSAMSQRPVLRGVVFDLDGTLTVPNLDFAEMYRRCGVDLKCDILDALTKMPVDEATRCQAIIDEMEEEGRRTMQLMPGVLEVSKWLDSHGLKTSIVTRNTKKTINTFNNLLNEHSIPSFQNCISRDIEGIPPKPDPAALHLICKNWELPLDQSILMVGDSPSNDIVFGKNAGVATALLDTGRRYLEQSSGKSTVGADMTVAHMVALPRLLWETYFIEGNLGTDMPLKKYPCPQAVSSVAQAAVVGDVEIMKQQNFLLPDETGNTALIWASDSGKKEVVDFLLEEPNIDLNHRGYLGATAVCRAARKGHSDILLALARAGADLDIPNDKMQYPLHFASFKENMECVEILLQYNANTLVLDRKGRTPSQDTKNVGIRARIELAMPVIL